MLGSVLYMYFPIIFRAIFKHFENKKRRIIKYTNFVMIKKQHANKVPDIPFVTEKIPIKKPTVIPS